MFKRLEELKNWCLAREINKEIFSIISRQTFNKDFPLRDQMNKSAGSIMDNIAEGFGRNGMKEFILFLSISKGSCSELKSQCYRAFDRAHIDKREFDLFYDKIDHVEKMNSNLIKSLKANTTRGWKFENEPIINPESDKK